jgi:uncharacterized repeat protein (TIGR02543 family)
MFINVNGTWKSISDIFLNVSGTWKRIVDGFINVAGTWKRFLSSALSIAQQVQISQSTNATTFLTTLTGTNYYWSPGPPVLTYKFQRSVDSGVTWSDLDSGSIVNPAFGSSNTKTYSLSSSGPTLGVLPNVLNYYRFRVDATYGSLSSNSISSSTTIQGPTNVTIGLSSPTFASIQLSWTASTGASRYLIYRSPDNITFSQYASVTSTSLSDISDLAGGSTYYFYVVPITGGSFTYPGYLGNNSNTLVLPILATPTLSSAIQQSGGFYFNIDNYSASNTYNLSTTAGSVSRSGSIVTVSGLSEGASATVTVGATRSGYGNSNTATRTGTAPVSRTVTWDPQGGSVTPTSQTVLSGTVVTAPTPTRTHYTFQYWRNPLSGGDPIILSAGQSYTVTSNITFYAIWAGNTYTVTYNANGGSVGTASASVQYPGSVTLPTPTRSGYTFNGWYTASSGGSFIGNAGSSYSPTSNITIYAQWSVIQYTVTWNANGGSVSPSSNTVNAGGSVTAPTPTRSGFNFVRWTDTPSGDYFYTVLAGGSFTPPSSITMYARWVAAATIPSGGSVSLTGGDTAGSTITASTSGWSGSPTSYDVYITTALSPNIPTSSSSRVASSGGGSSTTYTITSFDTVSPVNIFRAFATASNSAGTSGVVQSSNTITAQSSTPATAPGTPGTPTNGWLNSGTTYPFSWTAPGAGTVAGGGAATITNYSIRIYEATNSSGTGAILLTTFNTGSGSSSYTYTSPNAANYYAASVAAINSAGLQGPYSGISQYK